jgi:hypothetical protein
MASASPAANGGPFPTESAALNLTTSLLAGVWGNKLAALVLAPSIAVFLWFLVAYQTSPLKQYPGPFLAGMLYLFPCPFMDVLDQPPLLTRHVSGWTNLWRVWQVISGEYAPRMKKLHEKYGPIVRIGPNLLDLDIPELYRIIYGTDGKWIKSDFYRNSSSIIDGKITYHMFSETDPTLHAQMKRPVVRHYSVPAVLVMEPLMDSVLTEFIATLRKRYVEPKKTCEFGDWLSYCKSPPPPLKL